MQNFRSYLAVLRIDHWFKNIFVLVGTLLAIYFFHIPINIANVGFILLALFLTCLVASVNYIINEILDAQFDKYHPRKKFRPIPSGKVKIPLLIILAFLLLSSSLITAYFFFSKFFFISLSALFISGIIYNVKPLRTKELPYLDVLTESINNPIRLLIGWFTFYKITILPPVSALLAFWFFGGLLMTAKRYAEFRFIGDKEQASNYRKSFKYYSEGGLLMAMITYANLLFFFLGIFIVVYNRNLIFTLPFILLFIVLFFKLTFENDSIAKEPEKIFRRPLFLIYCLLITLIFWLCQKLPPNFTEQLKLFQLLK